MLDVFALATRNLLRYRRRTLLTLTLILIGVLAVLMFIAIAGTFKSMITATITDSSLGHMQVHRKGYVASVESLPLNLNMKPPMVKKVEEALQANAAIETWAPRVKFGAMFSNYAETTSTRVNGIDPEREVAAAPLLPGRLLEGDKTKPFVARGEIVIPELLARGMKSKIGDTIVLVATNLDGSVNGRNFVVRGILESIAGPGGRDSYVHMDDARELLRMKDAEVSEIVVRLKDFAQLEQVDSQLRATMDAVTNKEGKPALEVHNWADLSPFANMAKMIDVMTLFIKIVLISLVLVAVMNVMIMAVFERIREIGTLAAIGTPPSRILSMFLAEGLMLGVVGTVIGVAVSLAIVGALNLWPISFDYGRQKGLLLEPALASGDILAIAGLVIAAAIVASLQPAWKASRLDPIQALRHS